MTMFKKVLIDYNSSNRDDYTAGCSLDYSNFKKYC